MKGKAVAGAGAALALVMSMALAGPASAATVRGCAQSWSTNPGTCIEVVTGTKNYTNRTQYVSKITVVAPRGAAASKLEAWAGNGPTGVAWYASTSSATSATWSINKWIKNGSGICGAYTWKDRSGRSIACITIKV